MMMKFKLRVSGKQRYPDETFDRFIVESNNSRVKYWYAQTIIKKNADEVVEAVNGMRWLFEEIKQTDSHFFDLLNNPEYGGSAWDLILSAVKRGLQKKKGNYEQKRTS